MRYLLSIFATALIASTAVAQNTDDSQRGWLRNQVEGTSGTFTGDLTLENDEQISNSTNGNVCLVGSGGASDETICFDLDGTDVIVISSLTGVATIDWGSLDHEMRDLTLAGDLALGGVGTFPNSGLHILDTNSTHDLIITPGSNLTGDRVLTITTGDAARTLTFEANAIVSQDYSTDGTPTFGSLTLGAAGTLQFAGQSIIKSSANHLLEMTNAAGQGVRLDLTTNNTLTLTDEAGGALDVKLHNSASLYYGTEIRAFGTTGGVHYIEDPTSGGGTIYAFSPQTITCADTGDGSASACGGAQTIKGGIVQTVCSDTDGCTLTLAETNFQAAIVSSITIIGPPANTLTIADSAGVVELAGGVSWVAEALDTLTLSYAPNALAWNEVDRKDAGGVPVFADYTRHHDVPIGAAIVGAAAPGVETIGTFRCYVFDANADLAHISVEVPSEWNGTSDMAIDLLIFTDDGDALGNGEVIEFDLVYRSVDEGQAYDNGAAVTIEATVTGGGAETDKGQYKISATVDYDDTDQPLAVNDTLGFSIMRDVDDSDTYSGDVHVCRAQLVYTANALATH